MTKKIIAVLAAVLGITLLSPAPSASAHPIGPHTCIARPPESSSAGYQHRVELASRESWRYCWNDDDGDPAHGWSRPSAIRIAMSNIKSCHGPGDISYIEFRTRAWHRWSALHWRTPWFKMYCEVGTSYKTVKLTQYPHHHYWNRTSPQWSVNYRIHRRSVESVGRVTTTGIYHHPSAQIP